MVYTTTMSSSNLSAFSKNENRVIKFKNYLAYGVGDLFGGGAFFIATTYMLYYLINVVGLNPILAGWIPLVGKLWDAINDPLMGYIADRTPPNRFGRRRVWFLISIVPIGVSFLLLWLPLEISSQGWLFFYYVMAYILFYSVTTMSYVPYAALSAEMTLKASERNRLGGFRIFFSFVATLIAGLIIEPILAAFDGGKMGYFVMGIIFSLIFALPWIGLYFGTWELPQFQKASVKDRRFFSNFFSLFKNRSCRIHITMYVCSFATMDIMMALMKFYFNDYLGVTKYFVVAQGILLITMILVLPLYIKIATKWGHAAAYKLGLLIVLVGIVSLIFISPSCPLWIELFAIFIIGFGMAAGSLIPHQLMPFVADVDRLMSGKSRPGTYSAAMTLTRKLVLAFVILRGISYLLGVFDYQQALASKFKTTQYLEIEKMVQTAFMENKIEESELILFEKAYAKSEDELFYTLAYAPTSNEAYNLRLLLSKLDVKYNGLDTVRVAQKESTKIGIKWMIILAPMVMIIMGLVAASLFRLTPKTHAVVLNEIARLEEGGLKADVDPETKKICELLTGIKYEKLYPQA